MTTPAPAPFPTCQCCPRRLLAVEVNGDRAVCRPCETRLYAELDEVVTLWGRLPDLLRPGAVVDGASDAPRAPGPSGSKPPANLAVLSLLGGGVADVLLVEEDAWRRELRKTEPRTPYTPARGRQDAIVVGTVGWLGLNLPWACRSYPDVDDLDRTLRKLLGEMRGLVTGDRRRREELAPACPMPERGHADDDATAPKCGGQLTYDPRRSRIVCAGCRRSYGPADWDRIGAAAGLITLPFTLSAAA